MLPGQKKVQTQGNNQGQRVLYLLWERRGPLHRIRQEGMKGLFYAWWE